MGELSHRPRGVTIRPPQIVLAEPDLGRPSGGSNYNEEVARAWPGDAPPLVRARIGDPQQWVAGTPDPVDGRPQRVSAPPDRIAEQLRAILHRHDVTIVDGLIGSEHPDVIGQAQRSGHRVVLLVHMLRPDDTGLTEAERTRLARLEAAAVRSAWRVVVTSRFAAADLASRYGRADPSVAVPGVHPAPLAQPHEPPVLLQLGAIGPLKNQLLTAQAAFSCRDLDFRLRIVGPVVDQGYAAALADALNRLPPGVASLEPAAGPAARDALLAAADLLISVGRRETYGLTVSEALARGVPAVVGRATGAVEALSAGGGRPGTVVATDDPGDLAQALRASLTAGDVRARWRAEALAARANLPTWASTATTIAQACRDDLANPPPGQ